MRNVTFEDVVFGPGAIGVALAAVTNYRDQYPPFPVNASLIPLFSGITVRRVSGVGAARSIGRAGEFEGLGDLPSSGLISGVSIMDCDLSTAAQGWQCSNVTGVSTNVLPRPCTQLGG